MIEHLVQKDIECDFCGIEMPKGFTAIEDADGNLYCSYTCFEEDGMDDSLEDESTNDSDAPRH